MLIRYLFFCFGCGMLQIAAGKTPFPWQNEALFDVPKAFLDPGMFRTVQALAMISIVSELLIGFHVLRWWGLVIWLPIAFLSSFLFPGKNPAPCVFIGIFVVAAGLLLLATA
jgi:hypothetical protein